MDVLNPLARDYKSIGTIKNELAELQEELSKAHKQVWKMCLTKYNLVTYSFNSLGMFGSTSFPRKVLEIPYLSSFVVFASSFSSNQF